MKKMLCLLLLMLFIFGFAAAQEMRILPSPYVYFGVADKYKPEAIANLRCSIGFDEYPEAIVEDYCALLVDQYGLVRSSREEIPSNTLTSALSFPHQTYLLDKDTRETVVTLYWADAHEATKILQVEFSRDCSPQALEVWSGDVSKYLYNADDWAICDVCDGKGECLFCDGEGHTFINLILFTYKEDCTHCLGGKCPGDCTGGKVRIHE